MKIKIILLLALLATVLSPFAQTRFCKGTVLSAEDNTPINGAVISILHMNVQAVSQANGAFELDCSKATDSVKITHVNFFPLYISLKNIRNAPFILRMQPVTKQLDEVQVNTGYQTIPKERATGSFEKISNQLFNQQTSTNVMDRLEWIANGLYTDKRTIQGNTNFVIRGLSTIQGPRAPLVVVDNFPYEGDLSNLNPNDVENIVLLKDAAAASIWGTRAGNGVIVITMKKARLNQPTRIEFNSNISIGEKPDLYYYNNISPSDYIDLEQYLYSKGFYTSTINSTSRAPLSPVIELLIKKSNGTITAAEADARINALKGHDMREDASRYLYQPSVNKQYSLGVRGGSGKLAYLFSIGYDDNIGTLNEKYQRLTLKSENNFSVSKNLQLTAGISFTSSKTVTGRLPYTSLSATNGTLPIYTPLADSAGNFIPVIKNFRQPYIDTAGAGKLLDWNYYPLDDHNHVDNTTDLRSILGNIGINFRIFKGLNVDVKYLYEIQNSENAILYKQESYFARNLINQYSQLNRATGVVTYKVPKGAILINNNSDILSQNFRAQVNYSKSWKAIELSAIAGAEIREVQNAGNNLRTYGYNEDILTYVPVDYTTQYPSFVSGNSSFIPNDQSYSERLNRFFSMYGNAVLSYLGKYSLTLSARRDASNLFGVNTNDKWTPLCSAGVGWDISKEKFYHFSKVSSLKLRATYGISGNADPTRSGFTVLTYNITSPYTQQPTASISQFDNPDLKWERIGMLNIGTDFKALKGRLSGSIEYYHKNDRNLLGYVNVDYTAVANNRLIKNVASMKANGLDIELNSINIKSPVTWTTNFNLNTNKETVTDNFLTIRTASGNLTGGQNITALPGRPVYGVYVYPWAGLDPQTGDPRSYYGGQLTKDYNLLTSSSFLLDSLTFKGSAMPTKFGSMGNTFNYKGLSLTVRLSWKFGYYFLRNSINYTSIFSNRLGHGDYALRWQNPGDEVYTNVPSLVYPAVSKRDLIYNNSEIEAEKGDHIRLQYITIDYDLKTVFRSAKLTNLNLYVNANNLGIIWRANKHGIDPDYRDNTILPTKNITIGVRAGF